MRHSMLAPRCDDLVLPPRQGLAGRHPQLGDHEVEARHLLGHRMLHLEPRVHLEEVELAALSTMNSMVPALT